MGDGLLLQLRRGVSTPVSGTSALRALLAEGDPPAHLAAALAVLSPPLAGSHDEPDWLRSAEMLQEAAACPGERLFAHTLHSAAEWRRADELAAAARALAIALKAAPIPARGSGDPLQGCAALTARLDSLPPSQQVRLRLE